MALVGYRQQAWNSGGSATLSFAGLTAPAGGTVDAAAGQMALVEAEHSSAQSPMPSGWTHAGTSLWWRMLTGDDITAGSVTVRARLTSLTVLSVAVGIGRTTEQPQVKVRSAAGAAIFRLVNTPAWDASPSTAPALYRVGAETVSDDDQHRHAVYFRAASAAGYVSLPSASDGAEWRAYEVVAPTGPAAPLLSGPSAGSSVDRAQPVTLSFAHQSPWGLPHTAARAVVRLAGGTWGSVRPDGTIAAGDTTQVIPGGSDHVTIDAGVLAAGAHEWYVLTQDSAGWSPASPTWTFVARGIPTVVVSFAAAAGDLSPSVSAVITASTGAPRSWQARICPAADGTADSPLWDSGVRATSAASVSLDVPAAEVEWVNGGSYRAWVLPADEGLPGVWTPSTPQTVSWTAPPAPSGIAATVGSPPFVTVTGVPAGSDRVQVQSAPVAGDWSDMATRPAAATVTLADPEAPYQVGRRYRARSWAAVDGVLQPSAWVESAALVSTDMAAYLVAADRSEWVQVGIHDAGALVPVQGASVTSGIGDVAQRVDRTEVGGWRSWWELRTDTADAEATVVAWLTDPDKSTIRLRPTPEHPLIGPGGPLDVPSVLVAPFWVIPDRILRTNSAGRHVRFDWTIQEEED